MSDGESRLDGAPEDNRLIQERREKLARLRERRPAFPNDFRRDRLAGDLHAAFDDWDGAALEARAIPVAVAGRMMAKRVMGRVSFVRLQDQSGHIQLFISRDALPEAEDGYEDFKTWDIGDLVGATGQLFKTRTGELSVKVDALRLLCKSLRPWPEKYHGLADSELKVRQRYLSLVMDEEVREVFKARSRIIQCIREYLNARGFLEVETPMMQALPGGAAARPFETYHNALNMPLYLRIAPELYLKRLVVGGFEKVYELNRNFRNEGVSTRHNPEFTMLEFYQAYADYRDLMDMVEDVLRTLSQTVSGEAVFTYQGGTIDLRTPFARLGLNEAILRFNPDLDRLTLTSREPLAQYAKARGIAVKPDYGIGKLHLELFEKTVEERLHAPTFITGFPAEVSPLARRNDADPKLVDRFELFIAGRELANGFSELNDPEDQAERFRDQVQAKAQGDLEAMPFDVDYIRALEYGLPPTAGCGIGIDRLVMLLTDQASIRDVLLFPQLRPESK